MKILKSLVIVLAMAAMVGGATSAAWMDQQVVGSNTFATGNLDISTNPASALFTVSDIYPGWNETKSIVVANDGTVPLNYQVSANKDSGDDVLWNAPEFLLNIGTTAGTGDIYSGTVKNASFASARNLAASANETIYFTVSLDINAGNGLQNKTVMVNFVFDATQP